MRRLLALLPLLALAAAARKDDARDAAAENLYLSAQSELRLGSYAETRRDLEELIRRYPQSDWALRADRLLGSVPGADVPESRPEVDAPYVPALPSSTPEESLARLRAAVARGDDDQALGEAYDFLKRYPGSPARDEVRLAAGALHLRRAEPRTARRFLEPLTRARGPLRARAEHLLGAALFALGLDRELLQEVAAADPAGTRDRWLALAQVWRAAALDRLGRRGEAAELYRALAASGQDSPVRAYALAAIAADWDRRGKPDRARDDLKRAGEEAARWGLDGLRDALALAAANELARARKLEDAASAYAAFARNYPESPLVAQAWYERGLALKRLDRKEEAAGSFEALLARDPRSAYAGDAHLQLGQLYGEMGRPEDALAHYRKMAKSSEAKDAGRESLLLMAQVQYNAKHFADAVPLYRRYLDGAPPQDPKTKEVEGLLLVCLWESNRSDPQLPNLAAELPDHPLVAQIRWDLAARAYKREEWNEAAELFRKEIEADPDGAKAADARFYRAEALRSLKSPDAADAYRRFLENHPADTRAPQAAMHLGAILYESGDAAGAAAAYARAPGADAAYDRSLALIKTGEDAAQTWEVFAQAHPSHAKAAWAWWEAGRLREAKKDLDGALRDYARVNTPASLYAQGRLHEKRKRTAAAKAAYEKLKDARPKNDAARLSGLMRLGLLLELEDKPRAAAPLYAEIVKYAAKGSAAFETARKRLEALTSDKSLLGK